MDSCNGFLFEIMFSFLTEVLKFVLSHILTNKFCCSSAVLTLCWWCWFGSRKEFWSVKC